jgi:elongation factor G
VAGDSSDTIRNVALIGHQSSGKTSLAEALLYCAGVRNRLGRVENGTTVCDTDPEEHARQMSLSLAVAPFEWRDHRINLIDTPGCLDFAGDVESALRVCDLAVLVVSAVDGIEVQTERYWHLAERLGVPRMVFVNKLDRDKADLDRVLAQLHDDFGAGFAPLELPIGTQSAFHGVADVLTETAYVYDSGHAEPAEIPPELAEHERQVHDEVVEGIVVADDELLEHYLAGEVPDFETLEHALAHGVLEQHTFPVLCGSATGPRGPIGIERLADFLVELGPSPAARPTIATAGDDLVEIPADPGADTVAFVFKTIADQFVGRVSLFKVLSGTIRRDDHLVSSRTRQDLRLHDLFRLRGKERVEAETLVAGDIGAAAKLQGLATGDTIAVAGRPVVVEPPTPAQPALAMAVRAATAADEDKLATALRRIAEEDPALVVEHHQDTHQTILRAPGETALQLALQRLQTRHGVAVETDEVQVAYRETITTTAEAEGRHKKQSGGHGQFAVAVVRVEPLPRGEGFVFDDHISGGAISKGYIPAVRAGVEEAMQRGGVLGHPVVDVHVTLLDGKEHSVDSSEMAFRAAGRLAFRAAVEQAQPVLLEPVSRVEVVVPPDLQGDVIADLNARRGAVHASTLHGLREQAIEADVPEAELGRYAVQLRSITGGRGRFQATPSHYDVVPAHLAEALRRQER